MKFRVKLSNGDDIDVEAVDNDQAFFTALEIVNFHYKGDDISVDLVRKCKKGE